MSPYQTALFLMRRRVVDPDFVVAYLLAETERAGHADSLRLSDHPDDRFRYRWEDLREAFKALIPAFQRMSRAVQQSDFVRAV